MATKPQTVSTAKRKAKPPLKAVASRKPAKSGFINARIEPKLKKSAEAVLDKIGLSTTDALTIFFKQVVAQKGMPFPVNIPNRETIKALRDAEAGRTESFSGTPEQLFAHVLGKKRR